MTKLTPLLQQIKHRRLRLGIKQKDMLLRIGVSRQQYQRLESKGNPRLKTLELIAKGLNSELMLIPKEKLIAVMAVIEQESSELDRENLTPAEKSSRSQEEADKNSLSHDPWKGLLGDD